MQYLCNRDFLNSLSRPCVLNLKHFAIKFNCQPNLFINNNTI